jgi:hypothetical protein
MKIPRDTHGSRTTHTHSTYNKNLCSPAIAIPASKLPLAGWPGVITGILRRLDILLYTHGWQVKAKFMARNESNKKAYSIWR